METNNKEIKRRSTFSLLFYINRTKVRKDGTCKLLCKVSIDAKSAPININAFVDPSLWNPETKRANGRSENARTVNLAIEKLTEKITGHYRHIRKKSIRQPGIHTIIDPEQIFFHLTGASCPNSVEQTRNPGRTTGTNTAKGALHRHLSPSRIESNGYWHLSAICSIQRAFATTAAWPPEILLIN